MSYKFINFGKTDRKLKMRTLVPAGHDFQKATEAYLEPSQTSNMNIFCKNNLRPKAVNYFLRKAPLKMFDWVLNTPLSYSEEFRKIYRKTPLMDFIKVFKRTIFS